MNRLIFGMDKGIARWVAERLPNIKTPENFGPYVAIGVADSNERPLAGIVYNGFRSAERPIEVAVNIYAASPKWAQRGVIHALFSYPFEQLGVARITAHVAKKNKRARRAVRKLGFIEEGCMVHGFDGVNDLCIYGLTQENWRTGKFGPRPTRTEELKEVA